jgi:hypothetical protein
MKNKIAIYLIAVSLIAPASMLWAAAGDATIQGANATATGAPATAKTHKHHGHHKSKKAQASAASSTAAPVTK